MASSISPFLMFQGRAEEAIGFYTRLFPNSAVDLRERGGGTPPAAENKVKCARLAEALALVSPRN